MVIQIVAFVLPLAKSWTRLKPQIPEIVIWEKIEQSWLLSRCVLLPTSLVSEWYVIFLNLDSLLIIYYRTNKSEVLLFLKVKSLQLRNWPSSNFCKKHTKKSLFVLNLNTVLGISSGDLLIWRYFEFWSSNICCCLLSVPQNQFKT